MERIKVTIGKKGDLDYSVDGVKGRGCKELTKFIDGLATDVVSSENTSEYNEAPEVEQEHIQN